MSILVARFLRTLMLYVPYRTGTTHGLTFHFLRRAKGIIGTAVVITYTLNQHLAVQLNDVYSYAPIIINISMVLPCPNGPLEQILSTT